MRLSPNSFLAIFSAVLLAACSSGSDPAPRVQIQASGPDFIIYELNPLPGDVQAQAEDISNSGRITGTSGALNPTAVVWSIDPDGEVTMINIGTLPGGTSSHAMGINTRGEIVGVGSAAGTAGFA